MEYAVVPSHHGRTATTALRGGRSGEVLYGIAQGAAPYGNTAWARALPR